MTVFKIFGKPIKIPVRLADENLTCGSLIYWNDLSALVVRLLLMPKLSIGSIQHLHLLIIRVGN